MMKNNKIKIIVEGKSDEIFIKALIKEIKFERYFDVVISGGKNKCEILNKKTIKNHILDAEEDNYKKVIILIDKITQYDCGIKLDCLIEIKKEYIKRILQNETDFIKVVVVEQEIECWQILGQKDIKDTTRNCYSIAKNKFKGKNKEQLAQRSVKKLKDILENKNKNKSFVYFLNLLKNNI